MRAFATRFRAAFLDLAAFDDRPIGALQVGTDMPMRFAGATILKVENDLITEEIDLDDVVTVLQQLGVITQA